MSCNATFKMQRENRRSLQVRTSTVRKTLTGWFCMLLFAVCLSPCRPSPQYQDHYNMPGTAWSSTFQPQFKFEISDTAAAYQLFLLIRHTDAYPFSRSEERRAG